MFTNYDRSILQLSSSIHHFYQIDTGYATNPIVDAWIQQHSFKRIFTILIDGMGSEILKKYANPNGYFLTHMQDEIETVYPPTTAAATTAFRCGKAPSETGWLGWNQHFSEVNDEVILFYGSSQFDQKQYGNTFAYEKLPVTFLEKKLLEKGISADTVWPSWGQTHPCADYADLLQCLLQLQEDDNLSYVYAYWDQFDTLMHKKGPNNPSVKEELYRLDQLTQQFVKQIHPDTGVLILADHGQIDVHNINITKDRELCSYLDKRPSLESRTVSFFLKEGCNDAFEQYFQQKYGQSFLLLSREEVLNKKVFGPKTGENRFEEFLGDYIAFATDTACLSYGGAGMNHKGQHAGTTKEERIIPVILSD